MPVTQRDGPARPAKSCAQRTKLGALSVSEEDGRWIHARLTTPRSVLHTGWVAWGVFMAGKNITDSATLLKNITGSSKQKRSARRLEPGCARWTKSARMRETEQGIPRTGTVTAAVTMTPFLGGAQTNAKWTSAVKEP